MASAPNTRDGRLRRDILEWDVAAWSCALRLWDRRVAEPAGQRVLDIGGRNGGLSLYWALRGCRVVCSDLHGPTDAARALHKRHGVADAVAYQCIDATRIDFPDNEFDVVCFKSVLGGVGAHHGYAGQQRAIAEMHRVLKPGGFLAFVENLAASALHGVLRRRFVSWGAAWRYVTIGEVRELLSAFRQTELSCHGFFAAFGRREWQRTLLHALDVVAEPVIPKRSRYIVAGCAVR